MERLAILLAAIGLVVGLYLGILWGFWHLWMYVLGGFWPGGPTAVVTPDYWLFTGAWFLLGALGTAIFGTAPKHVGRGPA